jgi:hypothetical protein
MSRFKLFVVLMAIVLSSMSVMSVAAQDADGVVNKCETEWTWCNGGTDDENAYWWHMGWLAQAYEDGVITESPDEFESRNDDGKYADPTYGVVEEDPTEGLSHIEKFGYTPDRNNNNFIW